MRRSFDHVAQGRRGPVRRAELGIEHRKADARAWSLPRVVARGAAHQLRLDVPEPAQNPYAALRIPNFQRYIAGLLAFTMAIQIQGTVVGWQVYQLTHDKLALGLIGLAEALPFISMSLYAGHIADRHDRRGLALGALGVLLLCSVALLVLPVLLPTAPQLVVRAIYAVIMLSGVARSFLQPARQALGAELVPRTLYGNAITCLTPDKVQVKNRLHGIEAP